MFLPKVQVIMPSFNRPLMVQQAIKSVQHQTLKDWRLYIMDNSSEHHWQRMNQIYMQFVKDDSRIVVDHTVAEDRLRLEKHYTCIVTNKALFELSQNEPYVVVTCDDIIMMEDKLQLLANFLDTHPQAQVVSGMLQIIGEYGSAVGLLGGANHFCAANMIDWCQPMFRRTLIEEVGKFAEHTVVNADADYFIRISQLGHIMYGIPLALDQTHIRFRMTRASKVLVERMLKGELME